MTSRAKFRSSGTNSCRWEVCWCEGGGESGWAAFSAPSGVQALELNRRPAGGHGSRSWCVCSDWPGAALLRAGSEGLGSGPEQPVGPRGIGRCQRLAPPPPLHHPSPPGFKQSSGDRWSNRKLFITPLLFPSRLGSAEKRRGRCLCSGVASVWDLLFSSQRLSGINTSSLPPSVRRSAATRHRRAEGPIDCTGLAFMIHTAEEEEDRGEAGRRDTAGAGTIKDGRGRRRPRGQRSP